MLSLSQALTRRQSSGTPLPAAFPSLEQAGARICRSQLSLIVGPPTAGKSLLALNLMAKWRVPTLAFLLDQPQMMAVCRFGAYLSGQPYQAVKAALMKGGPEAEPYEKHLFSLSQHDIQLEFYAPEPDDMKRSIDAYEQRYGLPPTLIVVDSLGNQSSSFLDEWAVLKAMSLELDGIARQTQAAVLAVHHTTDSEGTDPLGRTKILGKISQYARLILSVGMDAEEGQMGVAVVKNSEGSSDVAAKKPVILRCDPARMKLTDPADEWDDPADILERIPA